jgi:hypothetical protein
MTHDKGRGRRGIKERVIHTRVPEGLEFELKRLADSLRVPVSNIVRAVLENALEAFEATHAAGVTAAGAALDVNGELANKLTWLRRLRSFDDRFGSDNDSDNQPRSRDASLSGRERRHHESTKSAIEKLMRSVVGFQPLTLAKPTRCAFCQREITPEQLAYITVRDRRGPRLIVGEECLPKSEVVPVNKEGSI